MEKEYSFQTVIQGIPLMFSNFPTLFSPNAPDRGTLAMLKHTAFSLKDKVLDLGCGYGLVGILAAKQIGTERVFLCDLVSEAVTAAQKNALLNNLPSLQVWQSDAFENITDSDFTLILSNPPYHTDFSVAKRFIEGAFFHLTPPTVTPKGENVAGGRLVMVTKRREWYENKLRSVFGGVTVAEEDGYFVFSAEKRTTHKIKKEKTRPALSKKLAKKYAKRH